MKKFVTLFKSFVVSFAVYMWFLGGSLIVEIDLQNIKDSKQLLDYGIRPKRGLSGQSSDIDSVKTNCVLEERRGMESKMSNNVTEQLLVQARRNKAVRDNLIYIPQLEQLWCLVPKAASTSWSHKIIESLGRLSPKLEQDVKNVSLPIQVVLRKHFGNISSKKYREIVKSSHIKKVILTRHPFSRLVSAFEDKLKNRKAKPDSMYFYGHYGVKINRKYRQNKRENKRKEPTFNEFIEYLIHNHPDDYDEHWKPISFLCGVCQMQYNVIIKQENLKSDIDGHLEKLGFKNSNGSRSPFPEDNKTLKEYSNVLDYFKNLTSFSKRKLVEAYEDDFNLFRYGKDFI